MNCDAIFDDHNVINCFINNTSYDHYNYFVNKDTHKKYYHDCTCEKNCTYYKNKANHLYTPCFCCKSKIFIEPTKCSDCNSAIYAVCCVQGRHHEYTYFYDFRRFPASKNKDVFLYGENSVYCKTVFKNDKYDDGWSEITWEY